MEVELEAPYGKFRKTTNVRWIKYMDYKLPEPEITVPGDNTEEPPKEEPPVEDPVSFEFDTDEPDDNISIEDRMMN